MAKGLLKRLLRPILRRPVQAVRRRAPEFLWDFGNRHGYSVMPHGPGSPIPELPEADDPIWSRRSCLTSINFDLDAQLAFIKESLATYIQEFGRDVRGQGFDVWNKFYKAGDAEVLYALLRHLRPKQVLEIGSGHSTCVSSAAMAANTRDGSPGDLVAIDPNPQLALDERPTVRHEGAAIGWSVEVPGRETPLEGLTRLERLDCRELPFERFEALQTGDVLFLDTSHIVKLDGEVNWLILEVLPRLAPGVWVHLHDTFLPYEYPRYYFFLAGFLTEQYLLQAFLTGSAWRVEVALAALFRDRHEQLVELIPSLKEPVPGDPEVRTWSPCAIWIRRPDE
ncbi:MAG: class I SAM-dependent methyltransferase [Actinobacteria bacterium]|nr:class I SAM-dependent methyltransferase [Actinomycetota bacterium]